MTLAYAEKCAAALLAKLEPLAVRIEVAGSVRRRRPECGDIDLVVIPGAREEKDLLGRVVKATNLVAEELERRARAEGWEIRCQGEEIFSLVAKGVQVDVFYATPENWGSVLLCRTGSARHNIRLAQRAIERGAKWHPSRGLYQLGRVIGAEEADIFAALGLGYVPPAEREVGGSR